MKKKTIVLSIICVLLTCTLLVLLIDRNTDSEEKKAPKYKINYYTAESLEEAINDGKNVVGKVVQFCVKDYSPESIWGVNTMAGEHLNFISEEEIDVEAGDFVIGRITAQPTQALLLNAWKIPYRVLEIRYDEIEPELDEDSATEISGEMTEETEVNKTESQPSETVAPETTKIAMIADSQDYVGNDVQAVENALRGLGFEDVKLVESVTTDTSKTSGAVNSVTAASHDFSKGDSFEPNTSIVVTYWKVEKLASEYEKAFVRAMSNYSLYYMFDTDNKTVVHFGTNDTSVMKGTYIGDLETGVTINWSHGEWTEKFTNKNGSDKATLIDGTGFDWEYKACSVAEAQEILDGLN